MDFAEHRVFHETQPIYVIAEMAWSHTGDIENALKKMRGAKSAGADAIGIHLTSLSDYMVPNYQCVDGQTLSAGREDENRSRETAEKDSEQGDIYRYLDQINLSPEDWRLFFREAKEVGIDVCAMC